MPLWFWRTAHGDEIDVLLEQGGKFIAVECKYTEQPDTSYLKGMKVFEKLYGEESIIAGYIACRTPLTYPLGNKFAAVSGSLIETVLEARLP